MTTTPPTAADTAPASAGPRKLTKAEQRAAEARATEAENSALVEANRAKVVEAEATVPLAIAEAFRSGHLGVMDYYRLRNIQADTSMRDSIGKGDQGDAKPQQCRRRITERVDLAT